MNPEDWQLQNIWLGIGISLAVFGLYYAVALYSRKSTNNTTDL